MFDNNFISIIPLASADIEAPLISSELLRIIRNNKVHNKKTLIFYNRRGTARAWVCQDCGYFEKCPHCDIAFAYHMSPIKRLVCHQCNNVAPFPIVCPNCHGHKIIGVGLGVERIVWDMQWILGDSYSILRIDTDSKQKISHFYTQLEYTDIIISTSLGSTLVDPMIGSVIFLSFEINLSIPEYDMEEQIFDEILFYKKQNLPIYLQTYTPEHPLIREILQGNQKSFFDILKKERQKFWYPPFSQLVTIRVHHISQATVSVLMSHLVRKVQPLIWSDIFFAADQDIWEKRWWEWSQKIIIKWKDLRSIIQNIETEVVRNRAVSLEWN